MAYEDDWMTRIEDRCVQMPSESLLSVVVPFLRYPAAALGELRRRIRKHAEIVTDQKEKDRLGRLAYTIDSTLSGHREVYNLALTNALEDIWREFKDDKYA